MQTCMHAPVAGWDDRLPREKRNWWYFFWAYNLVMALIALSWFWVAPNHQIAASNLAISPEAFHAKVQEFAKQYETAPGSGVVAVPPGTDAYLEGRMWQWYPTLQLKAGQTYKIWVSGSDVSHSLAFPGGAPIIIDAIPGHMYGINITPDKAGTYLIYCAEFCGLGHQDMGGKLIVE